MTTETPVVVPVAETTTPPPAPKPETNAQAKDILANMRNSVQDKPRGEKIMEDRSSFRAIGEPFANDAVKDTVEEVVADPATITAPTEPVKATETPTETPKVETQPKVEEPGAVAKAFARIAKREEKLLADTNALKLEREQHKEALRKVDLINNYQIGIKKDPVNFLRDAFGLTPEEYLEAVIADGAVPQTQKTQDKVAQLEAKIAELQKSSQKEKELAEASNRNNEVSKYIQGTIAPMLNSDTYKHIRAEYGDEAAQVVWNTMFDECQKIRKESPSAQRDARWQQANDPQYVAGQIEIYMKNKFDKKMKALGVQPNTTTTATTTPVAKQEAIANKSEVSESALEKAGFYIPRTNRDTYTRERSR